MTKCNRQEGFSVTELLVVITLIAVLGAIATVSISSYNRRIAVKEVARAVDADLTELRTKARVRQRALVVLFETATNYRAFYDNNGNNAWDSGTDEAILVRNVSSSPAQIQVVGQALPFSLEFNGAGTVDGLGITEIITSIPTQPARRYCVMLFETGITRVAFTEKGADIPPCRNWTRAW